jgi:hypothetical protein
LEGAFVNREIIQFNWNLVAKAFMASKYVNVERVVYRRQIDT